jgi:hypothetical protein
MTPRPSSAPGLLLAGSGLLAILLGGCQLEQVQLGQEYIVYTDAAGACPRLTWQFVVDVHRAIGGMLLTDGKPLAKITGVLNPDDTFRMDLAATSGKTGTVNGAITSTDTVFTLVGDAAGTACNGQTFHLHGGQQFQGNRAGGDGG